MTDYRQKRCKHGFVDMSQCEQCAADKATDDRIQQLEAEVLEQCRINGMGAERELALMAKVERLERQIAELRKDAALGRWYESLPGFKDSVFYGVQHADAAIDEAMKSGA